MDKREGNDKGTTEMRMEELGDGRVRLRRRCNMCGKYQVLEMGLVELAQGLNAKKVGKHVQEAFPWLTPSEREMFLTGICDDCWGVLFREEGEESEVEGDGESS